MPVNTSSDFFPKKIKKTAVDSFFIQQELAILTNGSNSNSSSVDPEHHPPTELSPSAPEIIKRLTQLNILAASNSFVCQTEIENLERIDECNDTKNVSYRKFLAKKKTFLLNRQAKIAEQIKAEKAKKAFQQNLFAQNEAVEKKTLLTRLFHIIKKISDAVDDIATLICRGLPQALARVIEPMVPFIIGSVSGLVHIFEWKEAIKDLHDAYQNSEASFRHLRIAVNAWIIGISFTGVCLAISSLVFYATQMLLEIGAVTLPLVPGLLTVIYFSTLCKNALMLYVNKSLANQMAGIVDKLKENISASPANNEVAFNDKTEIEPNSPNIIQYYRKMDQYSLNKEIRNYYQEQSLDAEREVAFNTIEVIASLLTLTGLITGLLPLTLLGVSLSLSGKIFEFIDKKYEHKPTLALRNFFMGNCSQNKKSLKQLHKQKVFGTQAEISPILTSIENSASIPANAEASKNGLSHYLTLITANFPIKLFDPGPTPSMEYYPKFLPTIANTSTQ